MSGRTIAACTSCSDSGCIVLAAWLAKHLGQKVGKDVTWPRCWICELHVFLFAVFRLEPWNRWKEDGSVVPCDGQATAMATTVWGKNFNEIASWNSSTWHVPKHAANCKCRITTCDSCMSCQMFDMHVPACSCQQGQCGLAPIGSAKNHFEMRNGLTTWELFARKTPGIQLFVQRARQHIRMQFLQTAMQLSFDALVWTARKWNVLNCTHKKMLRRQHFQFLKHNYIYRTSRFLLYWANWAWLCIINVWAKNGQMPKSDNVTSLKKCKLEGTPISSCCIRARNCEAGKPRTAKLSGFSVSIRVLPAAHNAALATNSMQDVKLRGSECMCLLALKDGCCSNLRTESEQISLCRWLWNFRHVQTKLVIKDKNLSRSW